MTRRLHYLATRADSDKLLTKAAAAPIDALMLDMEDGVPATGKVEARKLLLGALQNLDWGDRFKMIRINDLHSQDGADDFSLVEGRPDALMLPKVKSVDDVLEADRRLTEAEDKFGVEQGSTGIYLMIERAAAVLAAREMFSASPRVEGALFGHADFTVDVGCDGISGDEFRLHPEITSTAHALIVMSAAATGVRLVGATMAPMRDAERQVEQMRRLFSLGYEGVLILSPRQVTMVEEAYRPAAADIEFAEGVVAAYEDGLKDAGTTVSTYNDWVVEEPFAQMAKRVLDRASAS